MELLGRRHSSLLYPVAEQHPQQEMWCPAYPCDVQVWRWCTSSSSSDRRPCGNAIPCSIPRDAHRESRSRPDEDCQKPGCFARNAPYSALGLETSRRAGALHAFVLVLVSCGKSLPRLGIPTLERRRIASHRIGSYPDELLPCQWSRSAPRHLLSWHRAAAAALHPRQSKIAGSQLQQNFGYFSLNSTHTAYPRIMRIRGRYHGYRCRLRRRSLASGPHHRGVFSNPGRSLKYR